jgi:hypothetical protein
VIRINTGAGADHVDQRVTVDQRTREGADVSNLLFPGQHGDPEIDEARSLSESLIGSILL